MSVDRGDECVRSPVRPVGVLGSRYLAGLTAARRWTVRRMVVEANGENRGYVVPSDVERL